ncbi:MAG: carbohydrate ABC transporter permease [Clostridia bacterium]|nr:carbohydrate ABC transporter permease [Clostridia bacterium]
MDNTPKIKKESKNKIRVEFERAPLWIRIKSKFFSLNFLKNVVYVIFRYILLIGVSYVILNPYIKKIFGSFMSPTDFQNPKVILISADPTLDQYKYIILENGYLQSILKTFLIAASIALIETIVCALVAYGLSKFKFKGNSLVFLLVVATLMIPRDAIRHSMMLFFQCFGESNPIGLLLSKLDPNYSDAWIQGTFIPRYILAFLGLGFKNGLFIFMLRQFFRGVPDELEESAYVDGSNTFRTFFSIILPISIPMLITVFIFSFSWQWTDNFYSDIFFTALEPPGTAYDLVSKMPPTLTDMIKNIERKTMYQSTVVGTSTILIALPLIIMYCFLQNRIVQGVERSGIVG